MFLFVFISVSVTLTILHWLCLSHFRMQYATWFLPCEHVMSSLQIYLQTISSPGQHSYSLVQSLQVILRHLWVPLKSTTSPSTTYLDMIQRILCMPFCAHSSMHSKSRGDNSAGVFLTTRKLKTQTQHLIYISTNAILQAQHKLANKPQIKNKKATPQYVEKNRRQKKWLVFQKGW